MDPRSADPRPRPAVVRRRGWVEVRWRQFRGAPRPVVRAAGSSLAVAVGLGIPLLAYDLALDRAVPLPGGDLRLAALTAYILLVVVAGAILTWLLVPAPGATRTGAPARTGWSAALGLFAAVPIAYLVLVLLLQVVKPLLA